MNHHPAIFVKDTMYGSLTLTVEEKLWDVEPVVKRPNITVADWTLRQTIDGFGCVATQLIGRNVEDDTGFVSSDVVSFDARTVTTQSGRVYQLKGGRGRSKVGDFVWSRYKKACGLTEVVIGD